MRYIYIIIVLFPIILSGQITPDQIQPSTKTKYTDSLRVMVDTGTYYDHVNMLNPGYVMDSLRLVALNDNDTSRTNEGSLTVGAGTSTTSLIQSNTSGSTAVTLQAGNGIGLSESSNTITITNAAAPDTSIYTYNGTLLGNRTVGLSSYDLTFDGTTDVVIKSSGNVGIGTSSPTEKLHIASGDILANQASAKISLGPQANYGDVHFGASGVGSPSVGSQDYGFYAAHNAYRTSTGAWKHSRTSTINAVRLLGSTGSPASGTSGFYFDYAANQGTGDIAWTNLAIIKLDGKVGIGTTSPSEKLHVSGGNVRFSSYGAGSITGTPTYDLVVDTNGKLIERALPLLTEVDGSITNEGSLTVGAGTASTSLIQSNTSGSTAVTLQAGTDISLSEASNTITITNSSTTGLLAYEYGTNEWVVKSTNPNATDSLHVYGGSYIAIDPIPGLPGFSISANSGDNSRSNEGTLTVSVGDANSSVIQSNTIENIAIKITAAGILTISETLTPDTSTITLTATEVDGSITNEGSLTVGAGTGTTSLIQSNTSGSTAVTLSATGLITLAEAGSTITIGATEVDGSTTNEGSLTVGAGTGSTSLIQSNTSGSSTITLQESGIVDISESGNTITIGATEVDGSTTNEVQNLSVGTKSGSNVPLNIDLGGTDVNFAEGTNITLTASGGNTITIAAASGGSSNWTLSGGELSPLSTGTDVAIGRTTTTGTSDFDVYGGVYLNSEGLGTVTIGNTMTVGTDLTVNDDIAIGAVGSSGIITINGTTSSTGKVIINNGTNEEWHTPYTHGMCYGSAGTAIATGATIPWSTAYTSSSNLVFDDANDEWEATSGSIQFNVMVELKNEHATNDLLTPNITLYRNGSYVTGIGKGADIAPLKWGIVVGTFAGSSDISGTDSFTLRISWGGTGVTAEYGASRLSVNHIKY